MYFSLYIYCRCLNNYDQAYLYLDEAIELKKNNPIAWYIRGEFFFRQNDYDPAVEELEMSENLKFKSNNTWI